MASESTRVDEAARRAVIHAAAIREFSARGYAATSMANIATAAGISRPALYQYFENKRDVFASAFDALVEASVDRALAGLRRPGTTEQQLDELLQRFDGDLWEQMAASTHSHELLDAKVRHAGEAGAAGVERLRAGVERYLRSTGAPRQRRAEWADVLDLSPKGFKFDQPSIAVYRRRLSTLARTVAADIDATTRP